MRNRFQNFMSGRYGNDQLNNVIFTVALIILVINLFTNIGILLWIAIALLVYGWFRMLSRDTSRRYAENERFLDFTSRFRRGSSGGGYSSSRSRGSSYSRQQSAADRRAHREQKKTYKFFQCPHCSQKIRIPKGKGKIEITCPKCRTTFIGRT